MAELDTLAHRAQQTKQTFDCIIVSDHLLTENSQTSDQPRSLPENPAETPNTLAWQNALQQAQPFWQHQAVFCLPPIVTYLRIIVVAPHAFPAWAATQAALWSDACLHDTPPDITTLPTGQTKPWWHYPPTAPVTRVAVIGAGIAGAATAYALAQRGVAVDVFERNGIAQAASGNRQGLLYAKIAAHNTAQTELLLAGYGFSRLLLAHTLTEKQSWQACGVLHLNDTAAEYRRNRQLAAQSPHNLLYQAVNTAEASALAGIDLAYDGLWWPYGAAIHPPAWVAALLQHHLIQVHSHQHITAMEHNGHEWHLTATPHQTTPAKTTTYTASHVVICAGAQSNQLSPLSGWPLSLIRGQTTVAQTKPDSLAANLRCALSGSSYISPAWQGQMCFGATFWPNNHNSTLTAADEAHNWQALAQLAPDLAADLHAQQPENHSIHGHAALRCDAFDHLPMVGPVGQADAMCERYAKLALDKHYRLSQACPYWPNLYLNTAHGSRGLSTAPLCGEAIAATILGTANPLSARLQQALHPNRVVIRSLIHHLSWVKQAQ